MSQAKKPRPESYRASPHKRGSRGAPEVRARCFLLNALKANDRCEFQSLFKPAVVLLTCDCRSTKTHLGFDKMTIIACFDFKNSKA
jgi:hypothetical protein